MRNIFIVFAGFAVLSVFSGCGTLNQKVGGPQLTAQAMEFAKQIPADSSYMSISYEDKSASTNKWASKVYPIFPVFYWSNLGSFTPPAPDYGVRTATIIFPVFWVWRDSVYNERGERTNSEINFNMDFVLGYEDRVTPKSYDFRCGILWIPGIGPFLGVGPEFFQFFWVPFTDFK
ncbi:MAG TPA: hypothetical protein DCZ94_11345 [Lentisphaeria bacterium]|nr:MAG: hypothetical protein A2X48_17445 [Lentisphaerae bacterium GWF2_49_21]HBC87541.1 hypothetical protein [Lentisphaeria bacterium]